MRWIDFSSFGGIAFLAEQPESVPAETRRVILVQNGDARSQELASLGFLRHVNDDIWVRQASGLTLRMLAESIEGASFRDADQAEVVRQLDAPIEMALFRQPIEATEDLDETEVLPDDPVTDGSVSQVLGGVDSDDTPDDANTQNQIVNFVKSDDRTLREIGRNPFGELVYEDDNGRRFVVLEEGVVAEDQDDVAVRFLRVRDQSDIRSLLSGVVSAVLVEGAGPFEYRQWLSLVERTRPEDVSLSDWSYGMASRLPGVILTELLKDSPNYRAVFDASDRLLTAFPALAGIAAEHASLAPFFRYPAVFALQRAVAQMAGTGGRVAIVSERPSAFLGLFDREARLVPFFRGERERDDVDVSIEDAMESLRRGTWQEDDGEGFDSVFFEQPMSRGDARDLGGFVTDRLDFQSFFDMLQRIPDNGDAIGLFEVSDESLQETEEFFRSLGKTYVIDGKADISSVVWPSRARTIAISIGGKLRDLSFDVLDVKTKLIDSPEDFWTWTTDILFAKSSLQSALRARSLEGEERPLQLPYVAASRVREATAAIPRSLSSAIGKSLARIQERCATVYGVPDVDGLVSREIGIPVERLGGVLSPEQIDAIALAIDAETRNRGFLIGDQMGLGKGRVLASLALRAIRQGKNVLFLTERAINITDFVRDLRDIGALDECRPLILNKDAIVIDEDGNPIVTDTEKEKDDMLRRMAWPRGRNMIIGTYSQFSANISSERNKKKNADLSGVALKSKWIIEALNDNVYAILDESHNLARANSNSAKNVSEGLNKVPFVMYSSGTWAKSASNMEIYKRLMPKSVSYRDISNILSRTGLLGQEIFSSMLAEDGLYIARQHDVSKCRFVVESLPPAERARVVEAMDRLADVLAEMAYLSLEAEKRVGRYNAALMTFLEERFGENDALREAQVRRFGLRRVSIGSPLYEISRAFLASATADVAARRGIDALLNGEKPIFLFDRTMGAVLAEAKDMRESGEIQGPVDFREFLKRTAFRMAKVEGETLEQIRNLLEEPEWPLAADRMIEVIAKNHPEVLGMDEVAPAITRAMQEIMPEWSGTPEDLATAAESLDQRLRAALEVTGGSTAVPGFWGGIENSIPTTTKRSLRKILRLIEQVPPLPLSTIDRIKEIMETESERLYREGAIDKPWVIGEITGRTIEYREDEFRQIAKLNKREIADRFQDGSIDALVINQSATTGIDLHDAEKYADRRPRVMIEVQSPADIAKQIQAYGRVSRLGQLSQPTIVSFMTGLAIEDRLLGMRNTKLRRLSANVTGSRENPGINERVPDIMNTVGDMVCRRYFQTRPQLCERMAIPLPNERNGDIEDIDASLVDSDESTDATRSASFYLARLALLPTKIQENVLRELIQEYHAAVEELEMRGQNPLKEEVLEGKIRYLSATLFDGVADENESVFSAPTYVKDVEIKSRRLPMGWVDVLNTVQKAEARMIMAGESPRRIATMLRARSNDYLMSFLPAGFASVDEALAANSPIITKMSRRIERLIDTLENVRPGSSVSLVLDGQERSAIVVDMKMPENRKLASMLFHPASYRVSVAMPGLSRPVEISLSTLLSFENFNYGSGIHGPNSESLRNEFMSKEGIEFSERRFLITGNMLSAMSTNLTHKLGRVVLVRGEDGMMERALLVSKRHQDLDFLPVRLTDPDMVHRALFLSDTARIWSTPDMTPHGVRMHIGKNGYVIFLPKETCRRFGELHEVDDFRGWLDRASEGLHGSLVAEKSAYIRADIPVGNAQSDFVQELLSCLSDSGHVFYMQSRFRPDINNLMAILSEERRERAARRRVENDWIENGPPIPEADMDRRVA